jgi:xylulokinase
MLAAMGEQWFDSFSDMSEMWINYNASINSDDHNVGLYQSYYEIYQDVYRSTRALSDKLVQFK